MAINCLLDGKDVLAVLIPAGLWQQSDVSDLSESD